MLGAPVVQMDFAKYQGLGNDFVIAEGNVQNLPAAEQVRALCDRRHGIGGDGLLWITPSAAAEARMIVINADGSRPEMCGNGLRCVARYLADTRGTGGRFQVETDAGVLSCELFPRGEATWVRLGLGQAILLPTITPTWEGQTLRFRRVSTGNPHAILFDADFTDAAIDQIGPWLSAQIPGGANVEFVSQVAPEHLAVVVWERGVGRTLACGTGAAAVVAAAAAEGRVRFDNSVLVSLPGGDLEVSVRKADHTLTLAGPAERAFGGSVDL